MRPKEFIDPFYGNSGIFHLASDHLESALLFVTENCFRFGVNTLALAAARFNVSIYCYELMNNHLHALVGGVWRECRDSFRWVLHRLSLLVSGRDGVSDLIKMDGFDVHAVQDQRQFKNETVYILRNCYKARICSPFSYPWCSMDVYFNPLRDVVPGTSVSFLGTVSRRRILQTREPVPDHYEIYDGRVLNRCFVDYRYVERCFGDSLSFFDAMRVWDVETSVALSHGVAEKLTFSDAELSLRIKTMCRADFGVDSPALLDRKSLLMLARNAHRLFGAGKNQLARLLNLSVDALDLIM